MAAAEGSVRITLQGDEALVAAGAVLTPPVPQTLDLLAAGGVTAAAAPPADAAALAALATVAYDPCFALMLVLDRPSLVPSPGGIQFEAEGPANGPIAWLADNQQKGISSVPSLTVHATAAFSREHIDRPADEVSELLLEAAAPWVDGPPATTVVERSLHRWKFAQPNTSHAEPLIAASTQPPIVCCGDAFGTAKVEGAAASGLAAARWVVRVLAGEKT